MPEEPAEARPESTESWLVSSLARTRDFAVVRLSLDGTIIGWHGAARLIFGYPEREIVGKPFDLLFIQEDRQRGIPQLELDVALRSNRSEDDRWHIRKDGSRFWGSGVVSQLHAHGGLIQGFVKVVRDRTDLRMRYLALQARIDSLASEARAQQAALVTMVHELRNPLSPLFSAAELLGQDLPRKTVHDIAEMIKRQVEVMRGLLESARPQAAPGAQPLRYERIQLQQALKPVVDGFAPEAAAKGIALQLILSEEPMHLEADPLRLHQMVSNLVSNAVKYTPPGGHVAVSATIEGDLVAIRVEDDGIGIDKDNLERIFELFVREGAVGAVGAVPGSGVGLAVVKDLASLHQGFVEARSAGRGTGSRFTLQLPLHRPGGGD